MWASLKDSLQVQHRTAPLFVFFWAVTTGFEPALTDRRSIMLPGYNTSPFVFPGQFSAPGRDQSGLRPIGARTCTAEAGGLQPLGLANAQPTHIQVAREGVEPTSTDV